MLLARIDETFPLLCPNCGSQVRIIGLMTGAPPAEQILTHIGEPAQPPAITPGRGPPAWDDRLESILDWDEMAQPQPKAAFEFDYRVSW